VSFWLDASAGGITHPSAQLASWVLDSLEAPALHVEQ
jgi:hypothetical protein